MENTAHEKHSWLKLSLLLLYMFLYGLVNVVGGSNDVSLNMDNPQLLLMLKIVQAVAVIIIFILPAVLIAILWTKPRIHYLGITKKPLAGTLVLAGFGILAAMPLINWLSELNQQMQLPAALSGVENWIKTSEATLGKVTEALTKGTSVSTLLLNLFVIAFMAALSEEIFFRGLLQKISIECFKNKHAGIWFAAIIFSAFHMQFYGFVPRMLMGAYLGYLFLWSGSLWPGILAHFLNNGMAVFLVWLSNRGSISVDADKIGMQQSETIYVIFSAVLVLGSLLLVQRMEKRKTERSLVQ